MDTSHNQRAHAKRTSSPATQDPNKHAKTPTRETKEPVRRSQSTHRHRGRGGRSKSHLRQEEDMHVLIPTSYKSTYCQEKQKQEKEHVSQTLHRHLEKHQAEKQEVLIQHCCYISQHAHEIKVTLHPTDKAVRGFKVFGDNASIYAAYVQATLEWGQMYCHYEG